MRQKPFEQIFLEVLRYYFPDLYVNRLQNLDEMHNFLGKYILPKLTPLELEDLIRFHRRKWRQLLRNHPTKMHKAQMVPEMNSTNSTILPVIVLLMLYCD